MRRGIISSCHSIGCHLRDCQALQLTSLVTSLDSCSHLRSAQLCQLTVPRTKTRYGDRSFSVSGPAVWNSLPAALRCDEVTLLTFRARLKAALFNT